MAGELDSLSAEAPIEGEAPPGSKPRLGPLAIEVTVEEDAAPGLAVDRSGIPVPDFPEISPEVPHA